jgi:proteasome assembly chaperone (PAC2) family protein
MSNPVASYAVLTVLTKMLDLETDLSSIAKEAEQMAEAMKALSQEVTDKYIDHFTEPLWERNPTEENE